MGAGATAAGALQAVAAVIPYAAVALIVANALGIFKSKKIVGGGVMGEWVLAKSKETATQRGQFI